jgi:hypothetical protein
VSKRIQITPEQRAQIWRRDKARCCKCQRDTHLEVSHVQHDSNNVCTNLALLCTDCHTEWHAVLVLEGVSWCDWLRVAPLTRALVIGKSRDWECTNPLAAQRLFCERAGLPVPAVQGKYKKVARVMDAGGKRGRPRGSGTGATKAKTSLSLTPEAKRLLEATAERQGVAQSALLEIWIREKAKAAGVR